MKRARPTQGSVLILALWTLSLLAILAAQVGLRLRDRVGLLSHLEKRQQVQSLAESGVQRAKAVLYAVRASGASGLAQGKMRLFSDNPEFSAELMQGGFEVTYRNYYKSLSHPDVRHGVVDEARKINVNKADREIMTLLFQLVLGVNEEKAGDLATAIYDWRVMGESELGGFFSDDYYKSLKFPYSPKKANFETLDELRLVKGITPEIYEAMTDFVTVYGDGRVNFNTASRPVLAALGLPQKIINAIIGIRSGKDGLPGTEDDRVFVDVNEVPQSLTDLGEFEQSEVDSVNTLIVNGWVGMDSSYFKIHSRGFLSQSSESHSVSCVVNINDGKIIYWHEE